VQPVDDSDDIQSFLDEIRAKQNEVQAPSAEVEVPPESAGSAADEVKGGFVRLMDSLKELKPETPQVGTKGRSKIAVAVQAYRDQQQNPCLGGESMDDSGMVRKVA